MNAMLRLPLPTAALLIGLTTSITAAQPASNPTTQSLPATTPPPAAVYPSGPLPPGVPQPGALPPGMVPPPNGFPPGAMPPGAFPPGVPPPGFVAPSQPQPSESSTGLKSYDQMFAEGQYAALIEKVNARLAEAKRKKQKISVGEHFAILRHKGESHLRLKSQHQAIAAFKDAAALEVADTYRAEPAAMVLLLQRSKQFAYSPRTGASKGQPIDVLADRKRALEALLGDELEAVRPKVAGKTPTALPQVLQMLEQTQNLRTIEMATTGGQAPQSVELLQPIGMQARF